MIGQLMPPDGGMLYTETNLHHLFPEPLNTITSGFFFILALVWIIKLKGFSGKHSFLSICSWILLIGSIGGTTYHGLRQWRIFIFMDWMPIMILCLMASVYFWIKALGRWYWGILVLILFLVVEFYVRRQISSQHIQAGISINYAVMALMVLLPVLLLLIKMHWHKGRFIFTALSSFVIALFFRVADSWALLPVGTHFLWHTFGAVATGSMFLFIYELESS